MPASACTSARLAAIIAILSASVALPAFAQDIVIDAGEVVVSTPNRTTEKKDRVGSKVEVVTKEEIEERAQPAVTDYLATLPGVSVSANGGTGGQETGLFVRGADKKYVKTLVNGIDISDPSATQVQPALETLMTGGVTGIELLKGSQSTLYGSDAVAGVLAVSTLNGIEQGLHHDIFGEYGAFGTWRGGYVFSGASETGKFAAGISGVKSDGISAAKVNGGAAVDLDPARLEADEFDNISADFAGEQQLSDMVTVFGSALYRRTNADYDDSGNPPTDNSFNTARSRQIAGRIGAHVDLMDGRWRNTVSVQAFDVDRDLSSVSGFGPFIGNWRGQRLKFDYQGGWDLTETLTLQYGADHERQTARSSNNFGGNTDDTHNMTGLWSQLAWSPTEDVTLTAGLRHDIHNVFGGHTTWRAAASWNVTETTRLHASAGTGFRAPSLYELYAPFGTGNAALVPEESISFDAGVEQTFLGGRLVVDVTGFMLDTDNLIDYSYATFSYVQVPGVTKRSGVEVAAAWAVTPDFDLKGAYTYTRTKQPDGLRRPRVPEHDIALSAIWRPAENWTVSATARGVVNLTDRVSAGFGTFNDVRLDDFLKVDAKIAWKPTESYEVYLRGENLLDQRYETVAGYSTPGISVFAGFRARFGGE